MTDKEVFISVDALGFLTVASAVVLSADGNEDDAVGDVDKTMD